MKLIEKMALEACGCKGVADECGCWAYELGFRRARDMIWQSLRGKDLDQFRDIETLGESEE